MSEKTVKYCDVYGCNKPANDFRVPLKIRGRSVELLVWNKATTISLNCDFHDYCPEHEAETIRIIIDQLTREYGEPDITAGKIRRFFYCLFGKRRGK